MFGRRPKMGHLICLLWFLGATLCSAKTFEQGPFRIVWWNIEKGLTNKKSDENPLNQNLKKLIHSAAAPDIIALGEFKYEAVDLDVLRELRAGYHEVFIPYNIHTPEVGIAVFAKGQIETYPTLDLDWAPPRLADEEKREQYRKRWYQDFPESYYFTRQYIRLRVTRGDGKRINFIPVHTLQPWNRLTDDYGKIVGGAAVGLSLAFGSSNPLMYQMRELTKALRKDFGQEINGEPVVLVGDFNFPKNVVLKRTPAYKTITTELKDAFQETQPSFPARGSAFYGKYPNMQIDHAFVSRQIDVRSSETLPIEGSDHYPIQITFQTEDCQGIL